MAAGEVTGASGEGLHELREAFRGTPVHEDGVDFETAYCLSEIGKQPDDYQGPQRYCQNRAAKYTDDSGNEAYAPCCRFHGGRKGCTEDNLEKLANLSHGYYAMQEHLLEDLSEAERDAYNRIMEEGAEVGITPEEDFFNWEDLQALALHIVTSRRLRQTLNAEGVERTVNVMGGPEGMDIADRQDEEHHLLDISMKERRLILKLKKSLGLTREHNDTMEAVEEGTTVEFLSEGMADAIKGEDKEYDPEDWGDDGG